MLPAKDWIIMYTLSHGKEGVAHFSAWRCAMLPRFRENPDTCTCTCYCTCMYRQILSVHSSLHYGFQACFPKALSFTMEPCGVTNMVTLHMYNILQFPILHGQVEWHLAIVVALRYHLPQMGTLEGEREIREVEARRHTISE